MIITISRKTGSGGDTVGKMIAEQLSCDFDDKELIAIDTSIFTKSQATEIIHDDIQRYNGGKNNA